jgi:hypothetical protein
MNDDDSALEARLRRFRPPAPPSALRDRVLAAAAPRRRSAWWEIAAAAVLLAAGATLNHLAHRAGEQIAAALRPAMSANEQELTSLTAALGGDDAARDAADAWMRSSKEMP